MNRESCIPRRLKATTLVEMLVVIIVSGLVFAAVTDGVVIFKRYSNIISKRISDNSQFYNDCSHLESLVSSSDSVRDYNEALLCYSHGEINATLYSRDSSVIVIKENMTDTVLRRVTAFELKTNSLRDSVIVSLLKRDNSPMVLKFTTEPQIHTDELKKIIENEKKYTYK